MAPAPHLPPPRLRVFLVDDELIVRKGLHFLLSGEPGLAVCGEADNEHDALEGILALQPDLAIVDLTLKLGDGLALIKQLHQLRPALKMLVFTMHEQAHFVTAAFAAGAHGYVTKEEGAEPLFEAIRVIRDGGYYLSKHIAAKEPALRPRSGPRRRPRAS